ncbi:MAG: hypothetical protein ABJO30_05500 [Hyphomicrobiales bacterium]
MSTFSGLNPSERATVKSLFPRKVAQPVVLHDRTQVRSTTAFLREKFELQDQDIRVLPVSTLEWSSTSFSLATKKLALVDVEQANAVSFLLSKSLLFERPIFAYLEFMIRAAESCYNSGYPGLSLLVAKKANDRLRRYSRSNKSFPEIARPMAPSNAAFEALTSGLVLAFVTGHEIGHLTTNDRGALKDIFEWISFKYKSNETEPSNFSEGQHFNFLKPECIQKFDKEGAFCGDIILGTKFAARWHHLRSLQKGEAFSDVLGLVALSKVALDKNLEPDIAAATVLELLEFTEMLMSLRRLLPRLPVRGVRTNVTFEPTSLGFRRLMFFETLNAMRKRMLPISEEVCAYWDMLPEVSFQKLLVQKSSGELYSVSNRTVHIARGALLVSSLKHMPEAPSEASIKEKFGPLAGNGFFLASCLKIPERWFRIHQHNNWVPKPEDETVPVGYASAIFDLANIVKKKSNTDAAEAVVRRQCGLDHSLMLKLIRHPRTQVFQRRVIGQWPNSVMRHI